MQTPWISTKRSFRKEDDISIRELKVLKDEAERMLYAFDTEDWEEIEVAGQYLLTAAERIAEISSRLTDPFLKAATIRRQRFKDLIEIAEDLLAAREDEAWEELDELAAELQTQTGEILTLLQRAK